MTHYHGWMILTCFIVALLACGVPEQAKERASPMTQDFQFETEQFADIRILRYQVPGFGDLSLQQKKLVYYLYEAGLSGRDIIWDQNYRHNLRIRRALENIIKTYSGDRSTSEWESFLIYAKRVLFSNGIHHHYSSIKIEPGFKEEYLSQLFSASDPKGFPLEAAESVDDLLSQLTPILFDPNIAAKKVNLDSSVDQVLSSATNFYSEDLTQQEVESFFKDKIDSEDPRPVSWGLNSQLVKDGGKIFERAWKIGGMYSEAIEQIVYWLQKATEVAESGPQKEALEKLIEYYRTGDLKTFDEYNILWVKNVESTIDVINGFIEVYEDPLGYKGSYEAFVSFNDTEATKRIEALAQNAQWFEDHSPILDQHKKADVRGISARVITVVVQAGDASPSGPIGINLPNANWIRQEHGSKSVNLGNIVDAYEESSKAGGVLEEFAFSEAEIERSRKYGTLADKLHTDLHEVVGHASGQLEPGIGTPKETLKSYASTIEEARADLIALYYLLDPKLVEIGVMPSLDVGKAGYDDYIRNGLVVQLARLQLGEDLEEAHMRNRQMVSRWVYEEGKDENIIVREQRDGGTFFVIKDYESLRELFGSLLREVQRITSTGDFEAGKMLVESYGVRVEPALHQEILNRYAKLNRAPYAGFINPVLVPVKDGDGEITDVRIEYPTDFLDQMLFYGDRYSFLPNQN